MIPENVNLYFFSLPVYFTVIFLFSLILLFLGIRLGKKYAVEKNDPEKHVSLIMTAQLGFTAFLIAFIFGIALQGLIFEGKIIWSM